MKRIPWSEISYAGILVCGGFVFGAVVATISIPAPVWPAQVSYDIGHDISINCYAADQRTIGAAILQKIGLIDR